MKRAVLLSFVDQALNSGFSLLLNLAFIAFATPAEFGRFAFILAGSFFAVSAQNALIVMPLTYLLPGRPAAETDSELAMLTSANLVLTLLALPVGLGLSLLLGTDPALMAAAAAYFATLMLREYARNILVVTDRIHLTLGYDAIAIALAAAAAVILWPLLPPEAAALGGLALGNLGALAVCRVDTRRDLRHLPAHISAYRRVWEDTRWALQGALQSEVKARSYAFLVERMRDTAALGTLNAGRVAISPLLLVSAAWCRVARPKLVEHLRRGQRRPLLVILWSGAAVVTGAALVYGIALVIAWPYLEMFAFRGRYGDMAGIVMVWWGYALAVGLTSVMSSAMEARRQFRELAVVGLIGALIVPLLLFALLRAGLAAPSAVLGLAGVSLVEFAVFCRLTFRNRLSPDPGGTSREVRS